MEAGSVLLDRFESVTLRPPLDPAPPVSFDVTLLALASVRGLGRIGIRSLCDQLGRLPLVWTSSEETIRGALTAARTPDSDRIAREIIDRCDELIDIGLEEAARLYEMNVHVLPPWQLPERLRTLPDAPRWMFVEGSVDALFVEPAVAIVGTRKPTDKGLSATTVITKLLAAYPLALVSGLAEGIDAEAHRVALSEQSVNVAFLGHGVDHVFPAETRVLRRMIVEQSGAVATEYLPHERYQKQYFVERNRLQAALADIVIPVEAMAESGTAHTVRFARKYGREVIGVDWDGANGLLSTLRAAGTKIVNIDIVADRKYLDQRFRSLADARGGDTYAFTRVERLLRSEARTRRVRKSDFDRLIETARAMDEDASNAEPH